MASFLKKIPPCGGINSTTYLPCKYCPIKKKQVISRILLTLNYFKGLPIIYLGQWLPKSSNRLPFSSGVQPFPDNYRDTDLHGVAPYRVYLVSLQPYLYILSVALVLISRWTGVTRYTALWCPDFPPCPELDSGSFREMANPKKIPKQVRYKAIRRPANTKVNKKFQETFYLPHPSR